MLNVCTINGLTLRLTGQAEIQLWDKRRYWSRRKRGWGDNIPDKTEEKATQRQTQRKKQKQEERQWDLHEKPKSGWETGTGKSTLLLLSCLCASERAVSCMKWVLSNWSSKLLSHHAITAANSKPLAILTYCPPWDHALQKSPFTARGFVLQLLPKLRCTGTKCCITFCCNILCEITRGLQSRLCLLWIQSCTHRERNVKISKVTEQWHYPFHPQNSWGIPFLLHVRTDHAH